MPIRLRRASADTVGLYMEKRTNPVVPFHLTPSTSSVLRWLGDNGTVCSCFDYKIPGKGRTRKTFSENVSRLKRDGFIRKEGKKVSFTEKGRIAYLKLKIERCELLSKDEVCLVVFDVPEKERRLRKFIRDFLSLLGFFPIQKSVWMSMFDATKELNEYFRAVGLNDRVLAFTAKR